MTRAQQMWTLRRGGQDGAVRTHAEVSGSGLAILSKWSWKPMTWPDAISRDTENGHAPSDPARQAVASS